MEDHEVPEDALHTPRLSPRVAEDVDEFAGGMAGSSGGGGHQGRLSSGWSPAGSSAARSSLPSTMRRSGSGSSKGGGGSEASSRRESLTGGSVRRLFRDGSRMSVGSGSRGSVGSSKSSILHASAHIGLKAAGEGDKEGVLAFLQSGGDVNAKSKTGASTPLSRAAAKGHVSIVTMLLERGAAVNVPGRGGLTPLHEAAGCSQVEVCRVLLGAGAAVAARDHSSRCPLHYAGSSVDVTELLLDFGADPEAKDKNGQRPDALAFNKEARALLRDARCAVRENGVGDNASRVIASLRRELENLEQEAVIAKTSAADVKSARMQLQADTDALRKQVSTLTAEIDRLKAEAIASDGMNREAGGQIPAVARAELRQVRAALKVARAAASAEKNRREKLEETFDAAVAEAVAKSILAGKFSDSSANTQVDRDDTSSSCTTFTTAGIDEDHVKGVPLSEKALGSPRLGGDSGVVVKRRDGVGEGPRDGTELRSRDGKSSEGAARATREQVEERRSTGCDFGGGMGGIFDFFCFPSGGKGDGGDGADGSGGGKNRFCLP